jgi:two-component system, response regulator, stage 0 sporulation protein F
MRRVLQMTDKTSILIVDDNETLLTTISIILKRSEHKVEVANNGHDAIVKVQHNSYDMIILDYKMPGLSGLETLKEIRNMGSDVPVVFMTAYEQHDFIDEAGEMGVLAVFNKPFEEPA